MPYERRIVGIYELRVVRLENLAGNNANRPFDRHLNDPDILKGVEHSILSLNFSQKKLIHPKIVL